MNRIRIPILLPASLASVLALAGCAHQSPAVEPRGPSPYGQEGIRVTATATARSAPDLAILTLGCEITASRAKEAKARGDAAMERIVQAVRKQGIPPGDIQTVSYEISRSWQTGQPPWSLSSAVEVRVSDVPKAAEIIDAATDAGANRVDSVRYRMRSLQYLRSKARSDAARVAKEKAEQIAKEMRVGLGPVVAVTDAPPENAWSWYGGPSNSMSNSARNTPSSAPSGGASEPDSQLAAGQASAEVRLEVVYAIRKE